ncbi:MAG: choice-of-anchor D domain-containing protein [Chlorobi bacterium]|nr:choice-of-anchor D domain-containing protein [Chlorobiota bacterium]
MKASFGILLMLILSLVKIVPAQWVQTSGPYGGPMGNIVVTGKYLFANGGKGVVRSTNNGESWSYVNNGLPDRSVATVGVIDTVLFASVDRSRLFRSTDYGEHWVELNTGLPDRTISCLASHGANLYAGIDIGVFLSTDYGESWQKTALKDVSVNFIDVIGDSIYSGGRGGVFRSTDNGKSWVPLGLSRRQVYSIAQKGNVLLAGTLGVIFRTTDDGQTWTEVLSGVPYWGAVSSFIIKGDDILACTNGLGIQRSTDDGITWKGSNSGLTNMFAFDFTSNGMYIYVGTKGGIFRSSDDGATWTMTSKGLLNAYFTSFVENGSDLFVGCKYSGIYRTSDNGSHWTPVNNGLTNTFITCLAVSDTYLVAGTKMGSIYRSTDNGNTWTEINTEMKDPFVKSFAVKDNEIFAGTYRGNILHSTDAGATWKTLDQKIGIDVQSLVFLGGYLIAGTSQSGIYRSSNGGSTWEKAGTPGPQIHTLTSIGDHLFALTFANIHHSTDYGKTWNKASEGIHDRVFSLVASDTNLFAGTENGVYISTNKGDNWIPVRIGLDSSMITSLGVHGSNLFAGVYLNGVWKRSLLEMINLPVISVSPSALDFGQTRVDSSRTRVLQVINKGKGTLVIDSVAIKGTHSYEFSITSKGKSMINPNDSTTVIIEFAPTSEGQKTAEVVFSSNDPLSPEKEIPLSGEGLGEPVPKITLDKSSVNFGNTYIGSNKSRELHIKNTGRATLIVSSQLISGPDAGLFSVENPGRKSIPPAGSEVLTLTFTPDTLGSKSATLTIRSNDSRDSVVTVPLTGNGILTSVKPVAKAPDEIVLYTSYPNPVSSVDGFTTIRFSLPPSFENRVTLTVYDVFGRKISTIIDRPLKGGNYDFAFSTKDLSPGIYFYHLNAGISTRIMKMVVDR